MRVGWGMKTLVAEALPFLEQYLASLIAGYSEIRRDGSYRLMAREDCVDDIERVAFDDITSLQLLVSRVKAAPGWRSVTREGR
jgi:hypothetical protein